MQGNQKENIFIALSDTGDYLTHAYVYPYENHHVSYSKPRNIVMVIKTEDAMEEEHPGLRQKLFDACLKRAWELKEALWPEERVQLYGGFFAQEKSMLQFYLNQGFIDDDAVLTMKLRITDNSPRSFSHAVAEQDPLDAKVWEGYIERHNEMYVQPIDEDKFNEFAEKKGFRLFGLTVGEQVIGDCMFFEEDEEGTIESFHILPGYQGKGLAKTFLSHVIAHCDDQSYQSVRLEAWQRNERAIRLYRSFGFEVADKTECYPGIVMD